MTPDATVVVRRTPRRGVGKGEHCEGVRPGVDLSPEEFSMAAVFKQQAHQLIDALPDSASWQDLAEKARYLAAVERGVEPADRGEFAGRDRVKQLFAKWGVDVEG